jgi:hypothetical protein
MPVMASAARAAGELDFSHLRLAACTTASHHATNLHCSEILASTVRLRAQASRPPARRFDDLDLRCARGAGDHDLQVELFRRDSALSARPDACFAHLGSRISE